jgi:Tol biopolymer transport system component
MSSFGDRKQKAESRKRSLSVFCLLLSAFCLLPSIFSCGSDSSSLKQAKELIQKGQYLEAITELQETIRHDQGNFEAHYQMALAYKNLHRHDEALKEIQITLSLKPDYANAKFTAGEINLALGYNPQAMRSFLDLVQSSATDEQIDKIISLTGERYKVESLTDSNYDNTTPVFSPDAQKIAFVRSLGKNDEIFMMNRDGSGELQLTSESTADSAPHFAPDGKRIIFASGRGTLKADGKVNLRLFTMSIDNRNIKLLFDSSANNMNPVYSPDESKIALTSDRDGNFEIYICDADGKNQRNLTHNGALDVSPAFSPDGKKIAFTSFRDGNSEIYIMNSDGTSQTRLTHNEANDLHPTFHPDGTKIAFSTDRNGNDEIYMMSLDGSDQERLTYSDDTDSAPSFSPDGKRLVFTSLRNSAYLQICVMNLSRPLNRPELIERLRKLL